MNSSTTFSGEPGRTMIMVHGRDFKPAAEDFMDISVSAMCAGIERDHPERMNEFDSLSKQLAYYGDLSNECLAGQGREYDEQLDIGDRRNALQKMRSIEKKKNFGVNRYDRLPGKTALSEFAADVVAPVLGAIGLSNVLISGVASDLAEYWKDNCDLGAAIRERVRDSLCSALLSGDKVLLLSHGTGCIVAYDVLWQLSHDPDYAEEFAEHKIDTWVTLGAPLGDSMVKRRLFGAKEKGRNRYPSNVVTWHNVSAEDDYLSHDNTLRDDFKPMLKQRQVSSIRDYRIYNMCVRYGKSNPHSSIGYLVHPRVAQIVCDWLSQTKKGALPKSIL
jgi:hypothetical protein